METIIGFVVGYYVGTQDGRKGLQRLRDSVQGIARSAEARKLAGQAVGTAEALTRHAATRSARQAVTGVAGTVLRRAADSFGGDRARAA